MALTRRARKPTCQHARACPGAGDAGAAAAKPVTKEKEAPAAAAEAPAAPAAAAVDPQALLARYLKDKAKLAEKEALAAAGVDPKGQRKLAEQKAQLAALEQQLAALNVDVAAAVHEADVAAKVEEWHASIKTDFEAAWRDHLTQTGRGALAATFDKAADPVLAEATKRSKRVQQTPLEIAKEKLERLKLKLEREQFHVDWLTARDAELAAQQQALRQAAAAKPAAAKP